MFVVSSRVSLAKRLNIIYYTESESVGKSDAQLAVPHALLSLTPQFRQFVIHVVDKLVQQFHLVLRHIVSVRQCFKRLWWFRDTELLHNLILCQRRLLFNADDDMFGYDAVGVLETSGIRKTLFDQFHPLELL